MISGNDRGSFAEVDHVMQRGFPIARRNGANTPQPLSSNNPSKAAVSSQRRLWPFPGMIVLMIASNIMIVGLTAFLAGRDSSFAVEPDYYGRSMRWNQTAQQVHQNELLGWTLAIEPMVSGAPMVMRVNDKDGSPVGGANVSITAFHHANASNRLNSQLLEIESGMFRSSESLIRPGIWELNFIIKRDRQTFTHTQSLVVAKAERDIP